MKFDEIFYVKSILPDDNNISIIIIITRKITMSNKYVLTLFVACRLYHYIPFERLQWMRHIEKDICGGWKPINVRTKIYLHNTNLHIINDHHTLSSFHLGT